MEFYTGHDKFTIKVTLYRLKAPAVGIIVISMPSADLRRQLRCLEAKRRVPKYPCRKDGYAQNPATLPGRVVETSLGSYQLIKTRYALDERHGEWNLGDLLSCSSLTASRLAHITHGGSVDVSSLAFLDTETTGLSGGAGTLAFLVGVGIFAGGEFILSQFFLRNPAEELGMLTGLADFLVGCSGVTTFNGHTFDLPLLESRFILNRRPAPFRSLAQLDLLPPARRLWSGRTKRCSLSALEQEVLGIARSGNDVPGWLIPRIYADYLRTGDTHAIEQVIYHNTIDILSMVTLATHLLQIFSEPLAEGRSGTDCLRLALWLETKRQPNQAERVYRTALERSLPECERPVALRRLALLLRRANRRVEALPLWEKLADLTGDDPYPCIEIAKYFEWHVRKLQPAIAWTERALRGVQVLELGQRRDRQLAMVQHRLHRLQCKRDRMGTREDEHG